MTRILYVEASPRKRRSASIEVARSFLDAYRAAVPATDVDTLDVWAEDLPSFGGDALGAKYAGLEGQARSARQDDAWREIDRLAARFQTADLLLFSIPLWNFSIPYRLKHLIDVVSQKDVLFRFDERGFDGMLRGKRAVTIYARGLDYAPTALTPADTYDFQRPYIRMWLRFIGVDDVEEITVEKTIFGPDIDRAARDAARAEAAALANRLGRRRA